MHQATVEKADSKSAVATWGFFEVGSWCCFWGSGLKCFLDWLCFRAIFGFIEDTGGRWLEMVGDGWGWLEMAGDAGDGWRWLKILLRDGWGWLWMAGAGDG